MREVLQLLPQPGTFIEIGCWDGEHKSQSIELERQGWKGVCVDPFPVNFNNRKCKVIPAAISKDGQPRGFIKVSIDRRHGGDVSYFSGFHDTITIHWPVIYEHCDYEVITIPTIRFNELPIPAHTNFLSVDTEGSELEIFESIDFSRYTFDVIMFEHNGMETGVGKLLELKGYQLYKFLPLDDIYVSHKIWLNNEYNQWIKALQESTVHNFKDHPMVQRMLSEDVDAELYKSVHHLTYKLYPLDNIGRTQPLPVSGPCFRMAHYALKVLQLNPSSIAEIGGGVGQFYAVLRLLGYKGTYLIYDLPEVMKFQAEYLKEVERVCGLSLPQDLVLTPDLLVSFYALGEFTDEIKQQYLPLISRSLHGLILWNPHSGASSDIPFPCTVTDTNEGENIKLLTW